MTRVLFICGNSNRGGAQIALLRLISNLDRSQFSAMLYCPEGFLAAEARRLELTVHTGVVNFLGVVKIARLIRQTRVDVVNTIMLGAAAIGALSVVLSGTSPKLVVTVNNAILYPAMPLWRRWMTRLTYDLVALLDPIYFSKGNAVKEELLSLLPISSLRVHNIHNMIPCESRPSVEDRARARAELGIKKGEIAIGVIGSLTAQKGHHCLVEAAPAIAECNPDVRFYVVGDGPLKCKLERFASRACPGLFRFLGQREDGARCALAMDIVVLPSLFEGFPNALLEALAMCRPVVATAVGGCEEVIENGKNGLLIKAGDVQSLSRSLLWMLDHPERAAQMGKCGGDTVRQHYVADRVVGEVSALLDQASRKTQGRPECAAQGQTILLLVSSSTMGGVQTHVADLACGGLAANVHIIVACPRGPLLSSLVSSGVEVYALRSGFLASFRVASIVRATHAKIVHMHLLGTAVVGTLGSLMATCPRLIYTVHNLVVYPGMARWKRYVYPFLTRVLARRMDRIIVVSEETGAHLVHSVRVSQDKVRIVYPGVSFSRLERTASSSSKFRQMFGISQRCPLLGSVGRVTFQKGHDILIEAFLSLSGEFPALRCVIVGDGDRRTMLEMLIREFGIQDKVHLAGFQQDLLSCYRAMDIVTFPSRFEGFPTSFIEAAYAGRPIVATKVGAAEYIVQDGVTGLLVPPEDPIALSNAIRRLLTEPLFAADLGRRAREIAMKEFDVSNCIDETIQLYKEVLTGRIKDGERAANERD